MTQKIVLTPMIGGDAVIQAGEAGQPGVYTNIEVRARS
jgi:hypothetical protein